MREMRQREREKENREMRDASDVLDESKMLAFGHQCVGFASTCVDGWQLLASGRVAAARWSWQDDVDLEMLSSQLKQLITHTNFTLPELRQLHEIFIKAGMTDTHDGVLDEKSRARLVNEHGLNPTQFGVCMKTVGFNWVAHPEWLKAVFRAFDQNADGQVEFRELCQSLSLISREGMSGKRRLVFQAFLSDDDRELKESDLREMLTLVHTSIMGHDPDTSTIETRVKRAISGQGLTYLTFPDFERLCETDDALITFLSGDILVVPTSLSTATNSAVNLAGAELVGNEPSRSQRRLDEDTPLRHKTPQHTPSSTPKAIHPDVIHEAVDLQDPSLAGLKFV